MVIISYNKPDRGPFQLRPTRVIYDSFSQYFIMNKSFTLFIDNPCGQFLVLFESNSLILQVVYCDESN